MAAGQPSAVHPTAVAVEASAGCSEHLDLRVAHRHHPHAAAPAHAFWLVALTFVVVLLGTTIPTPLYVVYQAKFGFSSGTLTIVFAVYALGVLAALLMFGRSSDEAGRTRVLLGSLGVALASTLLFVFARNVETLLAARFLSGFAAGLTQGTATAALAELEPGHDPRRAALVSSTASMAGIGLGPLIGGLFAEYAGHTTTLVFIVYLGLLAAAAVAVVAVPETIAQPHRPSLRLQRLGVPAEIRAPFASAAVAVFAAFTLLGLFIALVPSFLGRELHQRNHAVAGTIVFLLFLCATLAQVLLHRLRPDSAMLLGFGWLLVGLGLLMLGLRLPNLGVFVAGTVCGGIGGGLVIMGGLATVNRIAPPEQRGAVISSFFVAAYAGLSFPAVGVGLAAEHVGFFPSTLVCSIGVAALLVAVAIAGVRRRALAPA